MGTKSKLKKNVDDLNIVSRESSINFREKEEDLKAIIEELKTKVR